MKTLLLVDVIAASRHSQMSEFHLVHLALDQQKVGLPIKPLPNFFNHFLSEDSKHLLLLAQY